MNSSIRFVLLGSAMALAACQQQPAGGGGTATDASSPSTATPIPTETPAPTPTPSDTASAVPATGENDGSPDITPAKLTGDAAKSEKGARNMLLAWSRGIELREFDQAWALMGDAAKAQTSKAQFNALFHPLRDIAIAVAGGEMEGAAGSSYYSVPTTVTGTRADGSKATLKGEVVLRRVNDVPGATAKQLAWHIEQVNLKPA
jgi:hypothetical protein